MKALSTLAFLLSLQFSELKTRKMNTLLRDESFIGIDLRTK